MPDFRVHAPPPRPAVRLPVPARWWLLGLCLALAGCITNPARLSFTVDKHAPQYVRGQLISAMRAAGYRKIYFRSFATGGDKVQEIRTQKRLEMRFVRDGDRRYVARVIYDTPQSVVTVRMVGKTDRELGAEADPERARIREQMSKVFVEIAPR